MSAEKEVKAMRIIADEIKRDRKEREAKREAIEARGEEVTYRVLRKCQDMTDPSHNHVVATGLTLEEAQAHCQNPDTAGPGWMDVYYEELD